MKVLVTGYNGQLGYDIVNVAKQYNVEADGVDIAEMDITSKESVDSVILNGGYDAVIHCAAYTAVDNAQDDIDVCRKVNVEGTKNIVAACKQLDIPVMYFSTDYVFDGQGTNMWNEYDERNPLNVYGQTKYEGELLVEEYEKHFIVRISWVFGKNGNNFIKTMLKLSETRDELSVVDDQIGSPTYTADLAILALEMIQSSKFGTYHATNEGICSWYEFACEIFKQAGRTVKVNPVDSSMFPVKAKRPQNSRMSKAELDKNGFKRLPDYQDAIKRYLKEIM